MLQDPRFPARPVSAQRTAEPASGRRAPLDLPVPHEPINADLAVLFSRAAEAHGVTPAAVDGLLENLPVGVLIVDRDGRVVYANAAARTLRVERVEPVQWAVTRALLTEDVVREDEIEVVVPGQPRRWLSAQVIPVRVAGCGVNAAFVTVADVTAKARLDAWNPMIESLVNL